MRASPSHNLSTLLLQSAQRHPRLPALAVGTRARNDYGSLATRVARLAATLARAAVAPGDRVAIVSANCAEYVEALFACWQAGACAVPVNSKLHVEELAFVLEDSGTRSAFVDAAWHVALSPIARRFTALDRVVELGSREYRHGFEGEAEMPPTAVNEDDAAWLFYTSGTTGRPKGVVLTHANLRAMSRCFLADVESVEPGDALLHPAPLSHGSGLYVIPHMLAGAVNVIPESAGFDSAEIHEMLVHWPRATFFAAPTMLKRLIAHPASSQARLDHLKSIVCGGAPLYVEDCKAALAVLGPRIAQIYGQGESPMTITAMSRAMVADAAERGDDARLGSVGRAQTGIDVRIGGEGDRALHVGQLGEVLVRGPTVMREYWRNSAATAATLANGWLHTGDVGVLDAQGFLTLKDRSKDLIISGGSNIYPREVEEVLQRHAAVREVAVVGRRHPDWGEEVVACIVARDGTDRAGLRRELDALCLEYIARFKRPKSYVFVAELPKNNTGKVLKTALRDSISAS